MAVPAYPTVRRLRCDPATWAGRDKEYRSRRLYDFQAISGGGK
jgi:hypothetical protein